MAPRVTRGRRDQARSQQGSPVHPPDESEDEDMGQEGAPENAVAPQGEKQAARITKPILTYSAWPTPAETQPYVATQPTEQLHPASLVPKGAATAMEIDDAAGQKGDDEGQAADMPKSKKRRMDDDDEAPRPASNDAISTTPSYIIQIGHPINTSTCTETPSMPSFKRLEAPATPTTTHETKIKEPVFKTGTAPTLRESDVPITAAFLEENVRRNDRTTPARAPIEAPKHTPVPSCGFYPPQHGRHTFWLLDGITSTAAADFLEWSEPKAFVLVWNEIAGNGNQMQTAERVEGELANILGHTDARVSPPPIDYAANNGAPITFFLTGISASDRSLLVERGCWSAREPAPTFFVAPVAWAMPRFICGIREFSNHITSADAHKLVLNMLQTQEVYDRIAGYLTNNGTFDGVPMAVGVARIIDSLEVTIIDYKRPGGNKTPIVNIYIDSPTAVPKLWYEWRNYIAGKRYPSTYFGTGVRADPMYCSGCHGVDHPRGLCPFATLPFWYGTREDRRAPPRDNYAGGSRGGGKGNRGTHEFRGRGRGRGAAY